MADKTFEIAGSTRAKVERYRGYRCVLERCIVFSPVKSEKYEKSRKERVRSPIGLRRHCWISNRKLLKIS